MWPSFEDDVRSSKVKKVRNLDKLFSRYFVLNLALWKIKGKNVLPSLPCSFLSSARPNFFSLRHLSNIQIPNKEPCEGVLNDTWWEKNTILVKLGASRTPMDHIMTKCVYSSSAVCMFSEAWVASSASLDDRQDLDAMADDERPVQSKGEAGLWLSCHSQQLEAVEITKRSCFSKFRQAVPGARLSWQHSSWVGSMDQDRVGRV